MYVLFFILAMFAAVVVTSLAATLSLALDGDDQ